MDNIRKSRKTGCSLRGEKHCSITHGATGLTPHRFACSKRHAGPVRAGFCVRGAAYVKSAKRRKSLAQRKVSGITHVHAAPPPRARLYAKSPAEYHVPSVTSLQHKTAPLRRVSGAPSTARAARGCKAANSVLASASGAPQPRGAPTTARWRRMPHGSASREPRTPKVP